VDCGGPAGPPQSTARKERTYGWSPAQATSQPLGAVAASGLKGAPRVVGTGKGEPTVAPTGQRLSPAKDQTVHAGIHPAPAKKFWEREAITGREVPRCGDARAENQGRGAPGVIAGTWRGREVARSAHMAPSRAWGIFGIIALSAVQPRIATLLEKANMEVL